MKTSTGFTISGHQGKVFETYFEALLPGTASALMRHPKKDRTIRVLSGGGFVILDDGKEPAVDKKIYAGDEVVLKAGTSYRFATTSDQGLEMHVSQETKYESRLEILEESSATADVSDDVLTTNVREPLQTAAHRRGSKARQQQANQNSHRVPSGQVISPDGDPTTDKDVGVATAAAVLNARPSMGRFDDVGAG